MCFMDLIKELHFELKREFLRLKILIIRKLSFILRFSFSFFCTFLIFPLFSSHTEYCKQLFHIIPKKKSIAPKGTIDLEMRVLL